MRWLFIAVMMMLFVPITACSNADTDGIKLENDNAEFLVSHDAFEDVLTRFHASDPFETIEDPVLGFRPLKKGVTGKLTAALYNPKLNMVVLNSDVLFIWDIPEILNNQLDSVLFHELGHAWFEQVPESIRNDYYALVLSQRKGSPDSLAAAILEMKTIARVDPSEIDQLFLWRAVKEDFATSFEHYFIYPLSFSIRHQERFTFLCTFFSSSDSRCPLKIQIN